MGSKAKKTNDNKSNHKIIFREKLFLKGPISRRPIYIYVRVKIQNETRRKIILLPCLNFGSITVYSFNFIIIKK